MSVLVGYFSSLITNANLSQSLWWQAHLLKAFASLHHGSSSVPLYPDHFYNLLVVGCVCVCPCACMWHTLHQLTCHFQYPSPNFQITLESVARPLSPTCTGKMRFSVAASPNSFPYLFKQQQQQQTTKNRFITRKQLTLFSVSPFSISVFRLGHMAPLQHTRQ